MIRLENFRRVKSFFDEELAEIDYDGVIGVADFGKVYDELMPVQRDKLKDICGKKFRNLTENGSVICIGIAYPEYAIDCIGARLHDGTLDKDTWNVYAREYHEINKFLNAISGSITNFFGGTSIPATVEGIPVRGVEDYYSMTISHRLVAENAGLGWRGKNELVVNERFSCALRFASVIVNFPVIRGAKVKSMCGECEACLQACKLLRNKDRLGNYRENCRKYINQLGLKTEVCGKCVKACYRKGLFANKFKLRHRKHSF
jgi:epoxyqueuosine reductase QueG